MASWADKMDTLRRGAEGHTVKGFAMIDVHRYDETTDIIVKEAIAIVEAKSTEELDELQKEI